MNIERKLEIWKLRDEGKSIPEICNIIKVSKGTIGYYLKEYEGKNKKVWIKSDFDFQQLKQQEGDNIINLYIEGKTLKSISKKYQVSSFFIVRFLKEKEIYKEKNRKLDINKLIKGEIQYNNPYYATINKNIKEYLLKNNIFEYKCNICNLTQWNNKYISLDLDHIDGNRNNNLLNNLRLLCPNCHSQTETYKGKKNIKNMPY